MSLCRCLAGLAVGLALLAPTAQGAPPEGYFGIRVVDEQTGRGVPLVELRTVNDVCYTTDSQGWTAVDEPSLVGLEAFFAVRSHGYEYPADGFGIRGARLRLEPGKTATLRVKRLNIAERLYRVTGEGRYRDSVMLGRPVPVAHPLLNSGVLGSDSVQNAVYQGRLFWLWGDTNRASYPLGNFDMTGATSALPGSGGVDPDRGIDLEYFTDGKGFVRGMAPMPGPGPTWLDALVVLPEDGRDRLFAAYSKIRGKLEVYERGLCRFDDAAGTFRPDRKLPLDAPLLPHGHPVRRVSGHRAYIYFGDPFPLVRVPADAASLRDLSRYEAYTCLRDGSSLSAPEVDRDAGGQARYAWRRHTPAITPEEQERLIGRGVLQRGEALFRFQDGAGKPVVMHRGTVHWNAYRRRFVMIANQIGGSPSHLGEVWYAEAATAEGPWLSARKIATHNRYSFYNPAQHPEFDQQEGRVVYFEGTYTTTFSGNTEPTPRYEYNQVMYRLDLADPRLR